MWRGFESLQLKSMLYCKLVFSETRTDVTLIRTSPRGKQTNKKKNQTKTKTKQKTKTKTKQTQYKNV